MWIIGLVIGAVVGAYGGGVGAVIGAMVGAAIGYLLTEQQKHPSSVRGGVPQPSIRGLQDVRLDARESSMRGLQEVRLDALESSIRRLEERLAVLERSGLKASISATGATAQDAKPETDKGKGAAEPIIRAVEPLSTPDEIPVHQTDELQPRVEPMPADRHESPVPPAADWSPSMTPRTPPQPSALWDFFFGGNALVRIGVVVLFFGVAFLLKYASEHIEIPVEARFTAVALSAIVMLVIGWRLRTARPGYALIIQGGAIGVLYLTVFAAFRLFQLLPAGLVFGLLIAMAVFSAMLAVLQDSRSLAALGVSGGFLAPILASTGAGSHVALFSYYALLNFGILVVAWFKAWRSLNLLGFTFTFVVGLIWGERYYRAEFFSSTEPFLILSFLFYVAIAVLFTLRQGASVKDPLDGTLVFGVPLVAFGLQAAMVHETEYATAFSAVGLSGFYLLLAQVLLARTGENVRLLVESFLAIGVVFGTLAIPLALDGRWTAAAWALEGAAILWVAVRQQKVLAQGFGIFLQFAAGVAFFFSVTEPRGSLPVFNSFYLGCVMISASGMFSAWYLKSQRQRLSPEASVVATGLFLWGVLWWYGAGFEEITEYVRAHPLELRFYRVHAAVFFVTASCAGFSVLRQRLNWHEALYPVVALLPLLYALTFGEATRASHPLEYFGYIVWPLALGAHLWLLRRHEEEIQFLDWWHAAGMWLFTALGAWEIAWWVGDLVRGGDVWRLVGWPLLPLTLVGWLGSRGELLKWPVARHLKAYLYDGAIVLAGFVWLWMAYANLRSRGDPSPLPYLPLFNPLDLVQCAGLITLFNWGRRIRRSSFAPRMFQPGELADVALGAMGFLWLNGLLLRTLHQWAGVPYHFDALMHSMLVQSSLSIFWSVLALCTMVAATRMRLRPLWLTGAGLMAVVVAKLFSVDLSNVGGIERIISFIGVGLLMLVVGYFSPVPPASSKERP